MEFVIDLTIGGLDKIDKPLYNNYTYRVYPRFARALTFSNQKEDSESFN